jgi:hypothetical protein
MRIIPAAAALPLLAAGLVLASCGACEEAPRDVGRDDAGCSYSSCAATCEAEGGCYGSCGGGTCHCTSCTPDADGDADRDGREDGGRDAEAEEARDAEGVGDVETREGGAPGVMCRKVPLLDQRIDIPADGQWTTIIVPIDMDLPTSLQVQTMRLFDWTTAAVEMVDDLADLPTAGRGKRMAYSPSLDGEMLAYGALGYSSLERSVVQLRLADLRTGEKWILAEGTGSTDRTTSVGLVVLRHPWVVWKQVSEETYHYGWTGWVINIETGDKRELIPRNVGVVNLDLLGETAVVSTSSTIYEVDVVSGEARDLAERGDPDQWSGVITPDWIAWLDQRAHPEGTWFSPYGTQVWGMNRETREVVPLVDSPGMHGPELDGEGDWLAYGDARDNPDPWSPTRASQNIYALHLPTRSEIRVEDWPGAQGGVKVYQGVGETRVLFFEDTAAAMPFHLWDCSLPVL